MNKLKPFFLQETEWYCNILEYNGYQSEITNYHLTNVDGLPKILVTLTKGFKLYKLADPDIKVINKQLAKLVTNLAFR